MTTAEPKKLRYRILHAAVLGVCAVAGDQLQPDSTPPTFRPAPAPAGSRGGAGAHLGEGGREAVAPTVQARAMR